MIKRIALSASLACAIASAACFAAGQSAAAQSKQPVVDAAVNLLTGRGFVCSDSNSSTVSCLDMAGKRVAIIQSDATMGKIVDESTVNGFCALMTKATSQHMRATLPTVSLNPLGGTIVAGVIVCSAGISF